MAEEVSFQSRVRTFLRQPNSCLRNVGTLSLKSIVCLRCSHFFKIQVLEIKKNQKIIFNKKMARKEIQTLFDEAMHFAKFSKSKTKVLFWSTVRKLEKFLASSPDELDQDQREKLNAAKKKFL